LARKQGQIISRGDQRWLVRVYQGRNPDSGRRRYLNYTIRSSFRAARLYLDTHLADWRPGRELGAGAMTVAQYGIGPAPQLSISSSILRYLEQSILRMA
jgi:hypothetical protein